MQYGRFLSFLSLAFFCTFSFCQLNIHVKTKPIQNTVKFVVNDTTDEKISFKSDDKKKPTIFTVNTLDKIAPHVLFVLVAILLISITLRRFFLISIFFKSNYVIQTPLFYVSKNKGGINMIIRYIMIAAFSLTATSLLCYQGVEFYHAFLDFFKQK